VEQNLLLFPEGDLGESTRRLATGEHLVDRAALIESRGVLLYPGTYVQTAECDHQLLAGIPLDIAPER
jgi:hypothetical protein